MNDSFPPDVAAAKYQTKGHSSIGEVTHQVRRKTSGPWRPYEDEHWVKQRKLGCGGQGEVFLQTCTVGQETGRCRAVKLVPYSDKSGRLRFIQELQTMIRFSTTEYEFRFVQMKGWYEIEERICIAMEYLPKGNLNSYLFERSMTELDCQQIISQVVEGLNLMHQAGLAHRDIKPQNILVKDLPENNSSQTWWIKLADFGIAHDSNGPTSDVHVGTEEYMAPELLSLVEESDTVDFAAADMYAIGVMACFLHTKKRGFGRLAVSFKDAQSLTAAYPKISHTAADFILGLTKQEPSLRCSSERSLTHSWIRDFTVRDIDADRNPPSIADTSSRHPMPEHERAMNSLALGFDRGQTLEIRNMNGAGDIMDSRSLIPSSSLPNTQTRVEPDHTRIVSFTPEEHARGGLKIAFLYEAIETGDSDRVDNLLTRGHAREFTSHPHLRHLNLALRLRFMDIARLLIVCGAPMSVRELCTAVTAGDPAVVELIAPYVANLSTVNEDGTTAFHEAALNGNPDMIKTLLALGVEPTCLDKSGNPPLFGPVSRGDHDTVRLLLKLGFRLDVRSTGGHTVLHIAASNGGHEMFMWLMTQGAPLSPITHTGDTILHCAAEACNLPLIQFLVTEGIDPSSRNENGVTPVYCSLKRSHLEAIKFYIERGVVVDAAMKSPELKDTAMATAIKDVQLGVIKLLREEAQVSASMEALIPRLAAESGYRLLVNYFLGEGYDFSLPGSHGETPLHVAARRDCAAVFELLLQIGLDPNSGSSEGETPFDLACQHESLEVLKRLIDLKAPNFKKYGQHKWPLSFLCAKGQELPLGVVELLLNTQTLNFLTHIEPNLRGYSSFSTYAYAGFRHLVSRGSGSSSSDYLSSPSDGSLLYKITREHDVLRSWNSQKEWALRGGLNKASPILVRGSLLSIQSSDNGYLDSFIRMAPLPSQRATILSNPRGSVAIIRAIASGADNNISFRFAKQKPLIAGPDMSYEEGDQWEWRSFAAQQWKLFRLSRDPASWGPKTIPFHNKDTYAFPTLIPNQLVNPHPIAALSIERRNFEVRPLDQRLTNDECILTMTIMIWILMSTTSLDKEQCRLWTRQNRNGTPGGKFA